MDRVIAVGRRGVGETVGLVGSVGPGRGHDGEEDEELGHRWQRRGGGGVHINVTRGGAPAFGNRYFYLQMGGNWRRSGGEKRRRRVE